MGNNEFNLMIQRMRLIVLRWEGDDELWSLEAQRMLCMASDGTIDQAIGLDIPIVKVDDAIEKLVTEASGDPYDGSAPSHDEVFAYIESHLELLQFDTEGQEKSWKSRPESDFTGEIMTYHGTEEVEFGDPKVPIAVDLCVDAVKLRLGNTFEDALNEDSQGLVDIAVERRPAGWVVILAGQAGGDADGQIFIHDDGRCEFMGNGSDRPITVVDDVPEEFKPKRE